MKPTSLYIALFFAFFLLSAGASAQQQPEQPDIFEQAEIEADRLQRVLDLEDWQTFLVDSTLKHDIPAMVAEYDRLRDSKVANGSMYYAVQDKWMERVDASYKKIFTEEQWAAYLKLGAAKAQKIREKRKEQASGEGKSKAKGKAKSKGKK